MPVSAANEGASHLRHFANARVIPASSSAHSGSSTSECVMLRCQVTMSSLSCEKMSRKTSASGKIAPSINDQVMKRPRFIGREANMSSPRKTALPMRAPAMPCVIVSMAQVTVIASAVCFAGAEACLPQAGICFSMWGPRLIARRAAACLWG